MRDKNTHRHSNPYRLQLQNAPLTFLVYQGPLISNLISFFIIAKDVIAIDSLGGAASNLQIRNLKGRPRLYIHTPIHYLSVIERFRHNYVFLLPEMTSQQFLR